MEQIEALRDELVKDVNSMALIALKIRDKIAANLKSDENMEGLLEGSQDRFLQDFQPQVERFNSEMELEVQRWNVAVEKAKKEAVEVS